MSLYKTENITLEIVIENFLGQKISKFVLQVDNHRFLLILSFYHWLILYFQDSGSFSLVFMKFFTNFCSLLISIYFISLSLILNLVPIYDKEYMKPPWDVN